MDNFFLVETVSAVHFVLLEERWNLIFKNTRIFLIKLLNRMIEYAEALLGIWIYQFVNRYWVIVWIVC